MWSRAELKTNAKASLKGVFFKCLVVIILLGIISACSRFVVNKVVELVTQQQLVSTENMVEYKYNADTGTLETINNMENVTPEQAAANSMASLIKAIVNLFLIVPLGVGVNRFYEKVRGFKGQTEIGEMFVPLKKFAHVGFVMFIMGLKIFLWSLLFIVPGIIKAYEYSRVPFILAENPDIKGKRAFQISKAMTQGHKGDLFVLDLSFILWYIGVVCTCGLLAIWVAPYVQATDTEAYYKLKAEALAKGAFTLDELPDICMPAQPVVPATVATVTVATVATVANGAEQAPAASEDVRTETEGE